MPHLEGCRGFLGRDECAHWHWAQRRIVAEGAVVAHNSNKVASYFWRYIFTRRSTILGLLSSASLLRRYHSAPCGPERDIIVRTRTRTQVRLRTANPNAAPR